MPDLQKPPAYTLVHDAQGHQFDLDVEGDSSKCLLCWKEKQLYLCYDKKGFIEFSKSKKSKFGLHSSGIVTVGSKCIGIDDKG